jgi:hypothetical protein
MALMKNLEEQKRRKPNNKQLIHIDEAFAITTMKDITLRNASCYRSFIIFVKMMNII